MVLCMLVLRTGPDVAVVEHVIFLSSKSRTSTSDPMLNLLIDVGFP